MKATRTITLAACVLLAACAVSPTPGSRPPSIDNSLGMAFVLVPAGEFAMGRDESAERLAAAFPDYEPERFQVLGDETPLHPVRITRPFYFGRHEVTVGQFARFLALSGYQPESVADGTGGYGFNRDYDPARTARRDAFEGRDPRYSWRNPGFPQGDDHPVVNVTWNDAQAMASWLSRSEGRTYRLPTEAEWEYACRAGSRTRYHSGDDPLTLLQVANIFDRDSARNWPKWFDNALAGRDGFAFTSPVGSFAPNAWGLYDMHGNAWEWVSDWYGEAYYAQSPRDDPTGPAGGDVRVRRGGSWHSWPFYVRASFRNWNTPQTRYTLVGMRLVLEAD
jgi:formylglycine-generating enzyme required for sulfatase activity